MKLRFLVASAMLIVAGPMSVGSASADVIVDTGASSSGTQWSFGSFQYFAGEFAVSKAYQIDSVSGYFSNSYGETGTVTAQLFSDGGNVPGALLFSKSFSLAAGAADNWYGVSNLDWNVTAGSYWLSFAPDANISGNWRGGAPSPLAEYAQHTSSSFENRGANFFDYLKVGLRVSGTVAAAPSAVPEPATWAMMILGMGAVGFAMRRRQKTVTTTVKYAA
ncbi:PEPxxWA-CTERM sorting domain-containing protein [Sphingomonas sp. A2-49]|uniref:PEPxxWA-CTERM sorting domain-containing protein n=1 Tax=Sphingomonas sp. A2-49 TaxID=1391375 RepID=UPI0021CF8625|nr:PEPxxWA-CTERM sorting domain-containing protein [Sphingomonas sp. A2-49]MCU6452863.1 PEPxxWA-CTERM sorting domain-containing protein [Sphingomonas sp. A2-49]